MAKPSRKGQLVRWLHYPVVMVVRDWAEMRKGDTPNTSVYTKAVCEWITPQELYQTATFPIEELAVAEASPAVPGAPADGPASPE
jgi:hypothetical protein